MATKSKSLSMLAKEQALKDIKEELSKSGKTFLTVSMRQLQLRAYYASIGIATPYCTCSELQGAGMRRRTL